jgi:hypothetical protein
MNEWTNEALYSKSKEFCIGSSSKWNNLGALGFLLGCALWFMHFPNFILDVFAVNGKHPSRRNRQSLYH